MTTERHGAFGNDDMMDATIETRDRGTGDEDGRKAVVGALPRLIAQMEASGVSEVDVRVGTARVLVRTADVLAHAQAVVRTGSGDAVAAAEDHLFAVTSPLTGVAYFAPAPDQPPYVKVGELVEAGQTVALVEAMKVFNEIHTERAGRVARLGVTPGQVVSTGTALVFIEVDDRPGG